MKIPKTLKIGGHIYQVLFPYHFQERGDLRGQHDSDGNRILLDDMDAWSHELRPESAIAQTFLHEILHACERVSGHKVFSGDEGERAVEGISEALFQVLRDNKLHFDEE